MVNKRILFVDHDDSRSGSTVSLEYLIKAFVQKGYIVSVLTPKEGKATETLINVGANTLRLRDWHVSTINLGFHFTNLASLVSWKGLRSLINNVVKFVLGIIIVSKTIRNTKAQLVYINEHVLVQASVAARLSGVPCVAHVRSPFVVGDFGLRRWLVSRLLLSCNCIIVAITESEATQIQVRGNEREKIMVVGEFFSKTEATTVEGTLRKKLLSKSTPMKIVAMLGGVQVIKGTLDFLQAAKIVISRRDDVLFVVAGRIYRGENFGVQAYFEQCEQLLATFPSQGRVNILGEIACSEDLIASCDIVVSPSTQSHFSRPVVEAWGFSKPVVATRTEHMKNLITEGVDGLLVDIGNYQELAESILRLLEDPELCQKLGNVGRLKVISEFDATSNTGIIVEKCENLINKG